MADNRFSQFATDPKFRPVPRKKKKVAIDARFQSMFKDPRFVSKVAVDKRGRPTKTNEDDFKKYYSLADSDQSDSSNKEESDDSDSSDNESEEDNSTGDSHPTFEEAEESSKTIASQHNLSSEVLPQVPAENKNFKPSVKKKLQDLTMDYARGEGTLDSESSSSEDESTEEEDDTENQVEEMQFDKWGELDKDADTTEDATSRLAVCNMDWDRVEAQDIFIALSSFCPARGSVKSVKVFVSDFGRKRLEEEDRLGPEELRMQDEREAEEEMEQVGQPQNEEEANKRAMEKVRRYQVNRLKYYYAVADFDSAASAAKVYEECDGKEYELSATRFDLRFVPDDMTFDEDPHSACDSPPDPEKYKPKVFTTTALQQGKVELTWDETDPERRAAMQRAFQADSSDENEDARAFLGSDSEEEEEQNRGSRCPELGSGSEEEEDTEDTIAKYKALLGGFAKSQGKRSFMTQSRSDEDGAMEMVFQDDSAAKKALQEKEVDNMTPWEKYLNKRKEKKAAKRESRKNAEAVNENQEGNDEPDLGFDDPFFTAEDSTGGTSLTKTQKQKMKKELTKSKHLDEEKAQGGALSLLAMESDDSRDHFDYKEIVKQESKKKGKRKGKVMKEAAQHSKDAVGGREFALDLQDNRFAAIFDNPDYNVDPSNPNFKRTQSMKEIIAEKQRRILGGHDKADSSDTKKGAKRQLEDEALHKRKKLAKSSSPLDQLVKSVKKKSKKPRAAKEAIAKRSR